VLSAPAGVLPSGSTPSPTTSPSRGGLCEAFNEGWSSGWDAARPTELGDTPGWYPGCGFPMETTATLTPTPSAK